MRGLRHDHQCTVANLVLWQCLIVGLEHFVLLDGEMSHSTSSLRRNTKRQNMCALVIQGNARHHKSEGPLLDAHSRRTQIISRILSYDSRNDSWVYSLTLLYSGPENRKRSLGSVYLIFILANLVLVEIGTPDLNISANNATLNRLSRSIPGFVSSMPSSVKHRRP